MPCPIPFCPTISHDVLNVQRKHLELIPSSLSVEGYRLEVTDAAKIIRVYLGEGLRNESHGEGFCEGQPHPNTEHWE